MHGNPIGEPPPVEAGAVSSALARASPCLFRFQTMLYVVSRVYLYLARATFCTPPRVPSLSIPHRNASALPSPLAEGRPYLSSLHRSSRQLAWLAYCSLSIPSFAPVTGIAYIEPSSRASAWLFNSSLLPHLKPLRDSAVCRQADTKP